MFVNANFLIILLRKMSGVIGNVIFATMRGSAVPGYRDLKGVSQSPAGAKPTRERTRVGYFAASSSATQPPSELPAR